MIAEQKSSSLLRICAAAALIGSCGIAADAGSWPQFRGPNGSGIPDVDKPLPKEIRPNQNLIWKTPLPPGHSSPVVVGDRIFVTADRAKHLLTMALDRASGRILWERDAEYGRLEQIHHIGSHAQSSPVADAERVVSFFGSAGLLCHDHAGKLLWRVPLGPFKNSYGAASSPILVGNLVILNQDHDLDSFLLAVDKRSGKVAWKTDRGDFPRGYCTPIVWKTSGLDQIVVPGALRICGYDPVRGEEQWTVRGSARICNMTPVIGSDGTLYVTEWAPGADEGDRIVAAPFAELATLYDKDHSQTLEKTELVGGELGPRFDQLDRDKNGHITPAEYEWARNLFNSATNGVIAIRPGGAGDVTETHVRWRFDKQLPYVPSPIFYKGHLYMVKNGGIASCIDVAAGKQVVQKRLPGNEQYFSSPVIGDGKLLVVDQGGTVTLLDAGPKLKLLSTVKLDETTFATPAIVDGRIYLRTAANLYCFGLPGR